ncbi:MULTISPECIES: Crp/Fnr family transcriptional regulator [Diaphorobacter]|uniref:Transcriptional regulator, Crp/Fnr family n=1 Tax=Acidovorax ebreus (strain TPSY) TaxID=535289 RepID=A0A9J9QEC5_ACIET|nr:MULTISPECIES: Crp/Fnr family transcriptional regulator [Diaphorobacter]ABM42084.1 putative transcriptional regulator, Crp/Fnr family [Acidovorax sp. JS42]ACM33166.1 transcriptional regulator, Crp/Fnr family [[Acidovorax] ebreus TPSY]TFI46218.1 Crp/Fnr family transcriptional regulator [Diaphorobacter sp. DS2]
MDIAHFDIPRYLAALPLFQEMAPQELERLGTGCRLRRYARGEMVFSVGMPCEEFHVTVMGQVKLFALSPAGQEKVIELAGPGISFAEALMFTDRPYIVNAQALTDTLLLSVGKAAVVREIENEPRFAMRMLAGISRRLHGLVHDVQTYTLHNGAQRVIGYLLHALPEDAPHPPTAPVPPQCPARAALQSVAPAPPASARSISLPVSKATIASRLSITPEYFSRVLHDLEAAGLIHIDKRDIHIPDTARLAKYPM